MPRPNKPWRNADHGGAWYAKVGGRKVRLADADATQREAAKVLAGLLADEAKGRKTAPSATVAELVARFLADCRGKVARGELAGPTADFYGERLEPFAVALGRQDAATLRPASVMAWLDARPTWGATTRFNAVAAVKRLFRWARKAGLIDADPMADLEKPRPRRREAIPDAAGARAAIDGCASPEFRDFLAVLHGTGCRPGEARGLTAADLDLGRGLWVKAGKTTRRTGRLRVVHLTPELAARLGELAIRWPEGPVLRNTRGEPWTRTAINTQVRRLRARIGAGAELTCYSLRHLFASDALEREVPIATVAELMGHRSTKMVSERYSHLSERHGYLKDALSRVRGERADGPPPSNPPAPPDAEPAGPPSPPPSPMAMPARPTRRDRRRPPTPG